MGTLKVFFSRNTGNFKNAWNNYLKCIMDTVFGILHKYCTAKKKKLEYLNVVKKVFLNNVKNNMVSS